jgi:hypothetical protein
LVDVLAPKRPALSHARSAASIALALLALLAPLTTACGSRGGGSRATTTRTGAAVTTATATGPKPRPPILEYASPKHPGIWVSWIERTPCDTVEGERHDVVDPYPSEMTVPGPPHFTVPAGTASYLDAGPTKNFVYTYHVRCKVQGVASDWSNELAANPTK